MKIMDVMVRGAVLLDLESDTKDAVLAEVSRVLADAVPSLDATKTLRVLREREAIQSTAIDEGVAIPHGQIEGLKSFVALFARSTEGVDFGATDGEPTRLFFLLLGPGDKPTQRLKLLARACRFFRDESFRRRLIDAKVPADVFSAIEEEDEKL